MSEMSSLRAAFEEIVSGNRYMVLATGDTSGAPWATPVWFATENFREYYWVSRPDARHSTNLVARPELGISIFDSRQPPGTSRGVFLAAVGAEVPEDALDLGLATFSDVSQRAGATAWGLRDVTWPARHRLYRAEALERFVLSDRDERILVPGA